jgi:hypothetical protein
MAALGQFGCFEQKENRNPFMAAGKVQGASINPCGGQRSRMGK